MAAATASPAGKDMLQQAFATPLAQRMKVRDKLGNMSVTGRRTEQTNGGVISSRMENFLQDGAEVFVGLEGEATSVAVPFYASPMLRTPAPDSGRVMQQVASAYKTFSSMVQHKQSARTPWSAREGGGKPVGVGLHVEQVQMQALLPEGEKLVYSVIAVKDVVEGSFTSMLKVVQPGDFLVAVDGQSTKNRNLDQVHSLLIGGEDTTCVGCFYRKPSGMYFEVPMLRHSTSEHSFEYNHHRNPLLSELTANGQRMAEMSAVKFKEETSLYEIYENIQSSEQTSSPPRAAAAAAAAAASPFSTPLAHRTASPMSSAKGTGDAEELQSPLVLSSPMKIASERVDLFLSHSPSADFGVGGGRGPTAASLAGDEEIEYAMTVIEAANRREQSMTSEDHTRYKRRQEEERDGEMQAMRLKIHSLVESYRRQQETIQSYQNENRKAHMKIQQLEEQTIQHNRDFYEQRSRDSNMEEKLKMVQQDLADLQKAYEQQSEQVSSLTDTTAYQTVEIFRLNEVMRLLDKLSREKDQVVGKLKVLQQEKDRGFFVPLF
ncbi:hypothetical protein GUITHDRAFT_133351 [Guillardia theta CCMP2712]|uniref:PDZ domain-containing protein n=1 Tax=Guillardia theta (strain CCMP2712) TaxID=905079 RepID=L1JWJ5_GUITC|nr:hypothetical protein GUITHDRAFT_133351 [Guillardia theta CCMP2712]EKX52946.1 hypothetical protein GUITHDRAFT_133351 [Guillardia theta CCMP2712]|eukprot:XP_005839926.1 hypothetical protein GUITHDRAFT_133351 [Guillardia theta CCMP2712]